MSNLLISAEPHPHTPDPEPMPASPQPVPAAVRTVFRRNLMDRQDPFETSGVVQREFTVNGSYKLPPAISAQQLADEIREEIHVSLVRGCVAGAEVEIVDFEDARLKGESPRRFVVTRTQTARRTPVNVNAYFQPYGEHLFYSVRSYTVPRLSLAKLLHTLWILMIVLSPFLISWVGSLASGAASSYAQSSMGDAGFSMGGASADGSGFPGADESGYSAGGDAGGESDGFSIAPFIILAGLVVGFRKFLRNLLARDPVSIALRKQFPGELSLGSFDDDDIIAFLKTNLDLTLAAISKVLEKHGIDATALRTVIQNLQTINVNTGGGEIVGAVFGGTGNVATGTVQA
jgi:hypothetical protein